MNFSEFLYRLWVAETLHYFGEVLPINEITAGTLEHRVDYNDPPIVDVDGDAMRTFILTYDIERLIYEQKNTFN
jgi:hypothetical protein